MRVPGLWRIEQVFNKGLSKVLDKTTVLCYHRVANLEHDPQLLSVSLKNFESQLKVIKEYYAPISGTELVTSVKRKSVPNNSVVITFDDGYADNLHNALPLLRKYNIPATVFCTSNNFDNEREFYWDELQHLYLNDCRCWNASSEEVDANQKEYIQVCSKLKALSPENRERALEAIRAQKNRAKGVRDNFCHLSEIELRKLAIDPLITVGGHTINHVSLPATEKAEQKFEVTRNKEDLERVIGKQIDLFAYPYGDFSKDVAQNIKERGFSYAFSLEQKPVTRFTRPYNIPRYLIRNWDGDLFHDKMKLFFS